MTPEERKRLSDKAAAQTAANRENALTAYRARGDELFESSMRTSTDDPSRLFCDDLTDKIIRLTNILKAEGRPHVPCLDVEPDLSSLFAALTHSLSFTYESVTFGKDEQLHYSRREEVPSCAAKVEKLRKALYDYCVESAAIAHKIGSATESDWRNAFKIIQTDCLRGEQDFCLRNRAVEVMRTVETAAETLYDDWQVHAAMEQTNFKNGRKSPSAAKVPRKKEIETAPTLEEDYGMFSVQREGNRTTIRRYETPRSVKPRGLLDCYRIKTDSRAYQIIFNLIKDYETDTRQLRRSGKDWPGAFQKRGNKQKSDANRFMGNEILRVPRWDAKKKEWDTTQYEGQWRIWTDEERKYSPDDRLAKFMREHPNGLAKRR